MRRRNLFLRGLRFRGLSGRLWWVKKGSGVFMLGSRPQGNDGILYN